MVVDATVPVLASLVLVVVTVAALAAAGHWRTRRRRRPGRVARALTLTRLRCPRVVLIDEVAGGAQTLSGATA